MPNAAYILQPEIYIVGMQTRRGEMYYYPLLSLRAATIFYAAALLRRAILVRSIVRIAVIAKRPWEVTR